MARMLTSLKKPYLIDPYTYVFGALATTRAAPLPCPSGQGLAA